MKRIALIFAGFSLLSVSLQAMNSEKVTIETSDGKTFEIDRAIAEKMETIKDFLEIMNYFSGSAKTIPLGNVDSVVWQWIVPLLKVDEEAIKKIIGTYDKARLIHIAQACEYLDFKPGRNAAISILIDRLNQMSDPRKALAELCKLGMNNALKEELIFLFLRKIITDKMYLASVLDKSKGNHRDWVRSLAVSGDGNTLYSGSNDNTFKVWDVSDSNNPVLHKSIDTSKDRSRYIVYDLVVSSDNKSLYFGANDGTINVWSIRDQQNPALLYDWDSSQGIKYELPSPIALSRDGKTLYSSCDNHVVKIWDVSDISNPVLIQKTPAQPKNPIFDHKVRSLAISSDNKTLYSGSDDYTLKIWNVSNLSRPILLKALDKSHGVHSSEIYALALSSDNKTLYSGGDDHTIKVWDVSNPSNPVLLKTLDKSYGGHSDWVRTLALSTDDKTLYSGSDDYIIKVWDVAHPKKPVLMQTLEKGAPVGRLLVIALSPNNKVLYSGSEKKMLKVWQSIEGDLRNLSCDQAQLILNLYSAKQAKKKLEICAHDLGSLPRNIRFYFADHYTLNDPCKHIAEHSI